MAIASNIWRSIRWTCWEQQNKSETAKTNMTTAGSYKLQRGQRKTFLRDARQGSNWILYHGKNNNKRKLNYRSWGAKFRCAVKAVLYECTDGKVSPTWLAGFQWSTFGWCEDYDDTSCCTIEKGMFGMEDLTRADSLMWKPLVRTVGRNWPEPRALAPRVTSRPGRPEICPRASQRRHAQWQVSAHLPQSASIQHHAKNPAESRRLERDSDYTLRPGKQTVSLSSYGPPAWTLCGDKPEQGPRPAESPLDLCQQGMVTGGSRHGWGYHQPPTGFFEARCANCRREWKLYELQRLMCCFFTL